MRNLIVFVLAVAATASTVRAETPTPQGARFSYSLPRSGSASNTWLVTLAIVDPQNPDWIISQFVAGALRTVTAENKGEFAEYWNGLDDNRMPVPPGEYGVKGICMPAEKWRVDDEYHAITPEYVGGVSNWLPSRTDADQQGEPFAGDPVTAPIGDIAVSPSGIAVFYYQYLENGSNSPMIDLTKPDGP